MITPELNLLTETETQIHIISERIIVFIGDFNAEHGEVKTGCKSVYVKNVEEGVRTIKHLMTTLHKQPSLIVYKVDSSYEENLATWQQCLELQPVLRVIPFFLYVDAISDEWKEYVRQFSFIDEIINKSALTTNLNQKISFIKKYKRLPANTPQAPDMTGLTDKPAKNFNYFLKRSFDILAAGTALLLLSPVFLLIAILIKLESKGPVFYAARRAGKNFQVFKFYKFRTMVADADKQLKQLSHLNQYQGDSVFYKVSNDPRITRLGAFLRNTSLDELPQLVNVLIGDMSLVGNRPLPLYEAAALTTDDWAQRFLAPAGITGLWQISKRGKKEMSADERIELDINYSRKHSFAYDMWIMMNTPKALVQKDNV